MQSDFEQYADEIRRGLTADAQPPAEAPPMLSTISAASLQRKDIPPIRWIVENLIPAGLNILASPPKYGKSWAVLDLGLSVTAGGRFLGYQTNPCEVLYLALEDSERRLKSRMIKLLAGKNAPAGFHFATAAHDMDNGLFDELEGFLKAHPKTGLIIIDTLQRVRGAVHGKEGAYAADYREVGGLKAFADKYGIAVLLVHHLRKMADDSDPFNRISGTNGLMGASDTALVLTKEKRGDETPPYPLWAGTWRAATRYCGSIKIPVDGKTWGTLTGLPNSKRGWNTRKAGLCGQSKSCWSKGANGQAQRNSF